MILRYSVFCCVLILTATPTILSAGDGIVIYSNQSIDIRASQLSLTDNIINRKKAILYKRLEILINGEKVEEIHSRGYTSHPRIYLSDDAHYLAIPELGRITVWEFRKENSKLFFVNNQKLSFKHWRVKDQYFNVLPCAIRWTKDNMLFLSFCDLGYKSSLNYLYDPRQRIIYTEQDSLKIEDKLRHPFVNIREEVEKFRNIPMPFGHSDGR